MGEPARRPKAIFPPDARVWWLQQEVRSSGGPAGLTLSAMNLFDDYWYLAGYKPGTIKVRMADEARVIGISERTAALGTLLLADKGWIHVFDRPAASRSAPGSGRSTSTALPRQPRGDGSYIRKTVTFRAWIPARRTRPNPKKLRSFFRLLPKNPKKARSFFGLPAPLASIRTHPTRLAPAATTKKKRRYPLLLWKTGSRS